MDRVSGYLTISGYDKEFRICTLHFPNEEVRYGFLNSLMPSVLGEKDSENPKPLKNMVLSLRNEIYLILSLLGQNVRCEVHTAQGRADCIVKTDSYIYIFEF